MIKRGYPAYAIKSLLLTATMVVALLGYAQKSDEKLSASQLKKLAAAAERNNDPETAAIYLEKYLEKKPDDIKIQYELAEKSKQIGKVSAALNLYQSVYEKEPKKYPLAAFHYAEMLVANGKCAQAITIYDDFRKDYRGEKDDRKYTRLAKFGIAGCQMKYDSLSNKVVVSELNDEINGSNMEGAPIFLEDNKMIYNSLKTKGKTVYSTEAADLPYRLFYETDRNDSEWKDKGSWKELRNFNAGEVANGAFNLNRSRFYFSACQINSMGEVSCDIYKMEIKEGKWGSPEKLPSEVNTKYTETQVAVGLDERERETIYFVSNRKEGKGGLDIWYSTYYEDKGTYREARNCGSKINSVGDEITPFINPLNSQLYFSSNGHPSFGGFDVFTSTGERSRWAEPENIGTAINTYSDELYYVVHPEGDEGVFASNRITPENKKDGLCCDNLYYYKEIDKIKITVGGSIVESKATDKLVEGVKMKLYSVDELGEKYFVQSTIADDKGNYELRLEPNKKYVVHAEKEGFLAEEKNLSTINKINSEEIDMDFELTEISEQAIQLENIYYEYGSSVLTEEALATIDTTIYLVLIRNPKIIIEIGAHTDDVGSEAYNKNLSQKRAESVMRYLRLKGIDKSRMTAKGYGETKPIAANKNANGSDNEAGRSKNRRTEFKVIGEQELKEIEED